MFGFKTGPFPTFTPRRAITVDLRSLVMGQTLSEPVTSKETTGCENVYVKVASSCMQGWRMNMEDAHTHILALSEDKEAAFFAVYDGHGGNLALSRALGDFVFKKNDRKRAEEQIVTAYPDVVVRDITIEHEFIVLACDGIWDVLTNQEVIDFVRARLAQQMLPDQICEELMMRCLAPDCQMGGLGCDNMTVVLVCLLQGQPWEDLCLKCGRPKMADRLVDIHTPPGDIDLHPENSLLSTEARDWSEAK
ncbi:PREDICTED: probable protein phosphatase 2C T23F11.1 [Priapulus caudatus]|uniref:protein-serine/threonine phosphatase n=1 Tax=Priapulus caudatus TaxID=37621 RepID=A0ABM1FBV9_PRICU|nr:PREDICTED: probable protein phosphatase 2C T23F11.1 [Priapulus caudatus]